MLRELGNMWYQEETMAKCSLETKSQSVPAIDKQRDHLVPLGEDQTLMEISSQRKDEENDVDVRYLVNSVHEEHSVKRIIACHLKKVIDLAFDSPDRNNDGQLKHVNVRRNSG